MATERLEAAETNTTLLLALPPLAAVSIITAAAIIGMEERGNKVFRIFAIIYLYI
jgi:hypothetical protein